MQQALQKLKKLKILVAVPSMGMWHEEFGKSLAAMIAFANIVRIGHYRGQEVATMSMRGSILPNLRLAALVRAKEMEADFLLWLDSDQSFPKETLHRLVLRNLDVVGANVATKTMPTLPTARRRPVPGEPPQGALVYTDSHSRGIEEVWRLGCGVTLMSRKVVRALPEDCFEMRYRPDAKKYQGEDWTMMEHVERLGFKIHVDHDLSNLVGYHGGFNYTHEYNGEVTKQEAA